MSADSEEAKDQRNRFYSCNQLLAKRRKFSYSYPQDFLDKEDKEEVCKEGRRKSNFGSVELFRTDVAWAFCTTATYNPFFFHFSFDNSLS